MKEEIKKLIAHANTLVPEFNGVQTRYPEELKHIIATLVTDHKLSIKKVKSLVTVSDYSISQWAKRRKKSLPLEFKEIKITPHVKTKRAYNKKKKILAGCYIFRLLY